MALFDDYNSGKSFSNRDKKQNYQPKNDNQDDYDDHKPLDKSSIFYQLFRLVYYIVTFTILYFLYQFVMWLINPSPKKLDVNTTSIEKTLPSLRDVYMVLLLLMPQIVALQEVIQNIHHHIILI
jgi:hypothetical protein